MEKAATVLGEGSQNPSPRQGAVQTGVEEATKRFRRYSPVVFSSHMPERSDEETIDGVRNVRIRCGYPDKLTFPFYSFRSPFFCYLDKVARSIRKEGIRIVHVRNRPVYMPYLRKVLGSGVKLILHEHNQNIADMLTGKKAAEVLDSIDAYVAVSKFTHDYEITNKYPQYSGKSHVILNGVNIEKFRPVWDNRGKARALREKHGVSGSKNILFTGAIRERKGVHKLVEAFKLVIKDHPDAKLIIAGGTADNLEAADLFARNLRKSAEEAGGRVVFLGYVPADRVEEAYLLADIYCAPSIWEEAFGLVYAEASASGLPVVASRRGGIPEIIEDGRTGLLINDPEDPSEIASKLNSLLSSPALCADMGRAGRKRMEDHFSWDRVAKEIEDLYDLVLLKG